MRAKLTIAFSDEVLRALKAGKSVKVSVGSDTGGSDARGAGAAGGGKAGRRGARKGGRDEPRAGSLPARVTEWAKKLRKEFRTDHVAKHFRLSRAHASMILSRLAVAGSPISRASRGSYKHR